MEAHPDGSRWAMKARERGATLIEDLDVLFSGIVSLLKAWFGDAATAENDYGFGYLPKLTGNHSHFPTMLRALDGALDGLLVMGQNPAVGSIDSGLQRRALAELKWLVVRDLTDLETAHFWRDSPEIRSGEQRTEDIATEVLLMPSAGHVEKEGHSTNTQRLLDLLRLLRRRRQPDAPARRRRSRGSVRLGVAEVGLGVVGEPAHPLQPRVRRSRRQAVVGPQARRLVGRAAARMDGLRRAGLPARQATGPSAGRRPSAWTRATIRTEQRPCSAKSDLRLVLTGLPLPATTGRPRSSRRRPAAPRRKRGRRPPRRWRAGT